MVNAYSFQGQEKDDEIKGNGNSINYKYRMHDPRLGRFFAVDPLAAKYPHNSVYAFSENKVIHAVELEGLESVELSSGKVIGTGPVTSETAIETAENNLGEGEYISKYVDGSIGLPQVNISANGSGGDQAVSSSESPEDNFIGAIPNGGGGMALGFGGFLVSAAEKTGSTVLKSSVYNLAKDGKFTTLFTTNAGGGTSSPLKLTWNLNNLPKGAHAIPGVQAAQQEANMVLKTGNAASKVALSLKVTGGVLGFYSIYSTRNAMLNGDVNYNGIFGDNNYKRDQILNVAGTLHWYGALLNLGYSSGKWIEDACGCNIQLIDTYQPPKNAEAPSLMSPIEWAVYKQIHGL